MKASTYGLWMAGAWILSLSSFAGGQADPTAALLHFQKTFREASPIGVDEVRNMDPRIWTCRFVDISWRDTHLSPPEVYFDFEIFDGMVENLAYEKLGFRWFAPGPNGLVSERYSFRSELKRFIFLRMTKDGALMAEETRDSFQAETAADSARAISDPKTKALTYFMCPRSEVPAADEESP